MDDRVCPPKTVSTISNILLDEFAVYATSH